jgi:CBS domain-containing protein
MRSINRKTRGSTRVTASAANRSVAAATLGNSANRSFSTRLYARHRVCFPQLCSCPNLVPKRDTMRVKNKPLQALTAADLMNPNVIRLPEETPLRDAAHLLLRNQISGAPVVDGLGKCVGVFSAIDFLRLSEIRADATRPTSPPLPITCSFQAKHRTFDGKEVTLCTLPPGVCPIQVQQEEPGGEKLIVCSQPHCVLADWQVVELEKLPTDEVRRFMTPDPVTARPATAIHVLARMMIDAHIHRVIVVDEKRKPIGIVSSTNLLSALSYSNGGTSKARSSARVGRGGRLPTRSKTRPSDQEKGDGRENNPKHHQSRRGEHRRSRHPKRKAPGHC